MNPSRYTAVANYTTRRVNIMSNSPDNQDQVTARAISQPSAFVRWLQDPMGSIIASSVAVIGSFGFVLTGSWAIHMALN